jgi:hypothetical protein
MMPTTESKVPVLKLALAVMAALGVLSLPFAQETKTAAPSEPDNEYIGATKCKNCHQTAAAGNQYKTWTAMKHSQAYELLASEPAKNYAAARGIDDAQKSEKCLKCHVTAFGEPKERVKKGFKPEQGVQCEACHGPGNNHLKARFAAAGVSEGEVLAYTVIPDEEIIKKPTQATCLKCHNDESPGFKSFCFHERMAKIRHLNPLKPRTAEERAALLLCGCGDECACVNGCADDGCGVPPPG